MKRAEIIDLETIEPSSIALPDRGEKMLYDSEATGLALRLRSSGARTWVVREEAGSKATLRTLGKVALIPLASARHLAMAQPRINGITPDMRAPAPFHSAEARISDVMPDFLASGEKGRWKASTARNMKAASATYILPLLGRKKVRDLTREEVTRWQLDVAAKSSAVRMALSTLSGLMLYAEDHGLRDHGSNPCRGLRKKQRCNRGQLLPAASVKRLWAALDTLHERMPDACDAVRLLLLTGGRRSEILALEWDRIVGSRAVLEESKTGPRTIWLNTPARAILDARKGGTSSRFVFPAPKSDGPIKVLDRQWKTIRKEAQLGRLRVHDLRHHFASVAVTNGIDVRLVGQLLGHHDIDSTLGYAHLATSALMRSASRVSGRIDRSLQGKDAGSPSRQKAARTAIAIRMMEAAHG